MSETNKQNQYSPSSISQNDINKQISDILKDFPNFDEQICRVLLDDSNYDVDKAKKEAKAIIYNFNQDSIRDKLFHILKDEFPQLEENIIEKAINFSHCNYMKAKFFILNNIKQNDKNINKKTILCDSDQVLPVYATRKPKKIKRRNQFIQSLPRFKNTKENFDESSNNAYQNKINSSKLSINGSKSTQFYYEPKSLNKDLSKVKSTQIKLSDTRNNNDNNDDDSDEQQFYQNVTSSISSSSKFSINRSNRMPERYSEQPNLKVKEINFHGMSADQVQSEVINALDNAEKMNYGAIRFITGAGHHSKNNVPVLRPLVLNICRKRGYKPSFSNNRGCIVVNLK